MRVLLVNPWIADFAAYNFWIRPLGLYGLAEWLAARGAEPVLLDALGGFRAPGRFRRRPAALPAWVELPRPVDRRFARYGLSREEFLARLRSAGPVDAVLVTSIMSYWYPGVIWAIEAVREVFGHVPVGLGGIYATLWPDHARRYSGADRVFLGNLEGAGPELASWLGLPRDAKGGPARWYGLGLHDGTDHAAVRTASGCPFACSYCASSRISGPFSPRSPEDVVKELEALASLGVRQICFYDDALLVDFPARLGPVLEWVTEKDLSFSFHTPNGLHARLLDREVARAMVRAGFETVRLSLETVNPQRQRSTGGKVSTDDLAQAVSYLLEEGMDAEKIGVYLLAGLPGQDLSEVEEGIRFVRSLGIRPYIAEYSPIPGTADWVRLEEAGIVGQETDPLLTNNTIFYWLLAGLDREHFSRLKAMARGIG